jgi:hypothetical protein
MVAGGEALTHSLGPEDRVVRDDSVIWRQVDGQVVILNRDGTSLTSLNETASVVWRAIDGSKTLDELAGVLADEYRIARDRAFSDVVELCNGLAGEGLIEPASGEAQESGDES